MKNFLKVPKNLTFTGFMMDIGDKTGSSRIFLHKDLVAKLIENCDEIHKEENDYVLVWFADDVYCRREIKVSMAGRHEWKRVLSLDIYGVEFDSDVKNPKATSYYISA